MKQSKGLILSVTAGLLLACSFGAANADHPNAGHTLHLKGQFAGTFLGTRIDLIADGSPASWSTAEVSDNTLGKRTSQGVSETVQTVPPGSNSECPGGVFIVDAQHGYGTNTSTFPNGDQIFSQLLTRTTCGLGGGIYTSSDTTTIVYGTGKFEGASGTGEQHSTSFFQVFDPNAAPPQGFGSFMGEFTATLILP